MQRRITGIAILTILYVSLNAQSFDPTWAAKFQAILDTTLPAENIKGASIAVYAPGMGMWKSASGVSSPGVPITTETPFGIGSNTKLFVAVTLLRLQEMGVLTLDDHLYDWLPDFENVDSSATIRQLLLHETGIANYIGETALWSDSVYTDTSRFWEPEEILGVIGQPNFGVGESYRYSNTNYLLAAMIIEAATGQPWYKVIREFILDPLQLDSTYAGSFEPHRGAPLAHPWISGIYEVPTPPMTSEYSTAHGAGSMITTASEFIQWYQALFSGEVISKASLEELLNIEPVSFYGLGIFQGVLYDEVFYYHGGGMLGYTSDVYYNTNDGTFIVTLINSGLVETSLFTKIFSVFFDEYPGIPDNAGIENVISPSSQSCVTKFSPQVVLKNYGNNLLTSAEITYQINGVHSGVVFWDGELTPYNNAVVTLPEVQLIPGDYTMDVFTSRPNFYDDLVPANDTLHFNFKIHAESIDELVSNDFEEGIFPPESWAINPQTFRAWAQTHLAASSGKHSIMRANYNDTNVGAFYDVELPYFNIPENSEATLAFDYAYAMYPGIGDSMAVSISTDCGLSWENVFYQGGTELMTAPPNDYWYYPVDNDWRNVNISLNEYEGDVLLRFRLINGWGNNIFLDHIVVNAITGVNEWLDAKNSLVQPNPFSEKAIIVTPELHDAVLDIYNLQGQLLFKKEGLTGDRIEIAKEQMQSGTHIYTISEKGKIISSGKFIALEK